MAVRPHARAGRDIFEILVRENADMLAAYLRGAIRDAADVDDLFQETMVVAWRRLDDYDRERPFGPWLRGIAKNLVLAHYRKKAKAPTWCTPEVLDGLDRRFEALGSKAGDSFRERVGALATCIEKLSDRLRGVIELVYGRGMSYAQAAEVIEEREDAVRQRAQRARRQLFECLQNTGVV